MKTLAIPFTVCMIALTLTACASTPQRPTRVNNTYQSVKVNAKLTQKYDLPLYYTQAQLGDKITQCVVDQLKTSKKFTPDNPLAIKANLDVDYQRVFMGETFGKHDKIGEVQFQYQTQLTPPNAPTTTDKSDRLIIGPGLLGWGSMFSSDADATAEQPFIDKACQIMLKDLTR